jgi:hypothetical protein
MDTSSPSEKFAMSGLFAGLKEFPHTLRTRFHA